VAPCSRFKLNNSRRSIASKKQVTRVAAIEEAPAASDEGFNKEEAYRKFEQLLGEYTFNFQTGDKASYSGALCSRDTLSSIST